MLHEHAEGCVEIYKDTQGITRRWLRTETCAQRGRDVLNTELITVLTFVILLFFELFKYVYREGARLVQQVGQAAAAEAVPVTPPVQVATFSNATQRCQQLTSVIQTATECLLVIQEAFSY